MNAEELAGLEEQRDILLKSLRDLEQERAAGEIGDADYAILKDDLTVRTAAALRAVEAGKVARGASRRGAPGRGGSARTGAARPATRRNATRQGARRQPGGHHDGAPPTVAPPTGARPTGARPTRARPTGARPTGAPPTGAPPTGAPPTGAPPTGAPPTGAPPTEARLTEARPARARPTGARPTGARPTGAPSTGARPATARTNGARRAGASTGGGPDRRRRSLGITLVVAFSIAAVAGLSVVLTAGDRDPGQPLTGSVPDASPETSVPGESSDRVAEALALENDGRAVDALKIYDEIIAGEPANAEALAYRGWLLKRAGLPDKALESLDRAVAADPTFPDAHFFRGMVLYQDMDDPAGAVAEFEAFLANDPPPDFVGGVQEVLAKARTAAEAKAAGAPTPSP